MNKPVKIAVVSHAQVIPVFQNRWKRLAKDKDYKIHLIVPEYWEQTWFSEPVIYEPAEVHAGNFHVHPLPTTNVKNWAKYLFKSIDAKFKEIRPDIIYIVHEEGTLIHHQIYLYRKLFAPKAKIIFFSMNARGVPYQLCSHPLKKIIHKWMWNDLKKNTDAALVHYPGCLNSLRNGGYEKPIYIQTQVGVDETLFAPNQEIRKAYRKNIGFENKFVIGFAGRLIADKGVDDLASVFTELAKENDNLALLLVGSGDLKEQLEISFQQARLENRVHITGFVDQAEVPNFMNAMDTFVLGSKTTPHWKDTFPLVTVQAQAVGVPVIASDSASLPWQLGDSAKIFPERNQNGLKTALLDFIQDQQTRTLYRDKGRERSIANFCHMGMTENFKKIVEQIVLREIIYHRQDESFTQWKAYKKGNIDEMPCM